MKMKTRYFCLTALSALACMAAVISCSEETLPDEGGRALILSTSLDQGGFRTRAVGDEVASDSQLYEDVVNRLDVFFFNPSNNNAFVTAYHKQITGPEESLGDESGHVLSNDWMRDGLRKNTPYDVYIVANSTNETITTATSGVTVASLQALVRNEATIYKSQGTSNDETYTTSKSFLMNGKVTRWSLGSGTQLVGGAKVALVRAAVKFVIDIVLDASFLAQLEADHMTYGAPSWKYVNFNTVAAEVSGAPVPEAQLSTRGSGGYLSCVEGTGANAGHYYITTYAYPQSWTVAGFLDAGPAVLLSFPAYDEGSATAHWHYYFVPVCARNSTGTQANKLYKCNVTVQSYGASEVVASEDLTLNYSVLDWDDSKSADIQPTVDAYLLVTPSKHVFDGGDEGVFQTETYHYFSNVTPTVTSVDAYYFDKDGNRQTLDPSMYTIETPANGEIVVKSRVPTNGTYHQVDVTVAAGDKQETFKFRHYPTDYIIGIMSSYSTYNLDSWVKPGQAGTYNASVFNYRGRSKYIQTFLFTTATYSAPPTPGKMPIASFPTSALNNWDGSDNHAYFPAKMVNPSDNQVYTLNLDGSMGYFVARNPHMYVLQCTASSSDHVVGYPELQQRTMTVSGTTVPYNVSTDDVLSPAFMLASQLGTIIGSYSVNGGTTDYRRAAAHCALYKEVAADGYEYTGWRLPTHQEIEFMIEKQFSSEMMDRILTAKYYWTLDGTAAQVPKPEGATWFNDNLPAERALFRCVRDLTAAEVERLTHFE